MVVLSLIGVVVVACIEELFPWNVLLVILAFVVATLVRNINVEFHLSRRRAPE